MSEFKPELIRGGKDKPMAESEDFREGVIDVSHIEEVRVFSEGEVLGLIEQIARKEGINVDQLRIAQKFYDSEGRLVMLKVRATSDVAMGLGWQSIEYDYMIKGRHSNGFTGTSLIARIYNLDDLNGSEGGIVAEYTNDKWDIQPGEIAPKADNIKWPEDE